MPEETDHYPPEEWAYVGPHPTAAGRFIWRDSSGEILVYRGIRARVFGGIYTLQVQRAPDGPIVRGKPEFTGRHAADAAALEITATDRERRLHLKRWETATSRTATIDAALAPLLQVARDLPTMTDRRALLDYVTARVYGA